MMSKKLVSIIIPVYNVEKYLFECLESVITQTYTDIEIIVVNDGSPDNSHIIIKDFADRDCRIKVINKKNAGLSAARNTGISAANGQYLMFVDSDDKIDVMMVEKLIAKIEDVDLVVASYYRMYEDNSIARVFDISGHLESEVFQRRLVGLIGTELSDPSQADSLVTAWGKLYKTSQIKTNKVEFVSTSEIGTEDLLFNLQYCNHISNCYILNTPLYFYRRDNTGSLTSIYKSKLFSQWLHLYSIIGSIIKHKNEDFQQALKNRISLSLIGLGLNEMQNTSGILSRYHNLKTILNQKLYKTAYSTLNLKYFPLHWKLFFAFAKFRFVPGVYVMLKGINYFVYRNNKN